MSTRQPRPLTRAISYFRPDSISPGTSPNASPDFLALTRQREAGEVAVAAAREQGLGAVGSTGGVAYNAAVAERLHERVAAAGLDVLAHNAVPPGDGELSGGQAVAAGAWLE